LIGTTIESIVNKNGSRRPLKISSDTTKVKSAHKRKMDVRACVPAISSTRQIPLVLALLMVAMVSSSEAFLGTKAIGGWQQKHNQQQQQQQQQRIRSITALQIAKSGGKAVVTEEQFRDLVLAEDVAIPVLVFFSAPW
jgi:hypothetical protein